MLIIDANVNVTSHLDALKRAGVTHIGRYISRGMTSKVVTEQEAKAIGEAGLKLFLIYESTAHEALEGEQAGRLDGEFALQWAKEAGAPQGAAIYATVDFDAGPSQVKAVQDYFAAFRKALGGYFKLGAYASGFICGALTSLQLIDYRWLSASEGFNGSCDAIKYRAYELRQLPDKKVAGIDVDLNEATVEDFGAFVPFSHPAQPQPAPSAPPPPQQSPSLIQRIASWFL